VLAGYNAGAGYDLATGLGSINVANLVNQWSTVVFRPSVTTLTLSPTSGLGHGQAVTVSGTVFASSGSGTPGGDVSLLTSAGTSVGRFTLSNGALSGSTTLLPGGSYTVTAHYPGDATFGGSDSTPVSITVGQEDSSTQIRLETFDWNGVRINSDASTAVYGSPYLMHVDVLNNAGTGCQGSDGLPRFSCPTGTLSLSNNSSPIGGAPFSLNSAGYADVTSVQLPGGTDSVGAQYSGDGSFNPSSANATYNITPAATSFTSPPSGCCNTVGSTYFASAMVQSQSSGAAPSGTITFYVNGNPISGSTMYFASPAASGIPPRITLGAQVNSFASPFPVPGNYTITAAYSGDKNYQAATSPPSSFIVRFQMPVFNLQPTPNPADANSAATLVATVLGSSTTIAPTGTVTVTQSHKLPGGTYGPLANAVSYSTITDPKTGNLDLQASMPVNTSYSDYYQASYSGDQNYPGASSIQQSLTVSGNDFVISALPAATVNVSQGRSGGIQLFVGFQSNTAPVTFGSSACTGLPSEASCQFSTDPLSSAGYVTLTVLTTAPHNSRTTKTSASRPYPLWVATLTPFAAILLAGFPRRRLRLRVLLTLLLLLGLGCGGGGTSGGGTTGNSGGSGGSGGFTDPGTPVGAYNFTVTAKSGTNTHSVSLNINVQQ
jgi:hypothetical protein